MKPQVPRFSIAKDKFEPIPIAKENIGSFISQLGDLIKTQRTETSPPLSKEAFDFGDFDQMEEELTWTDNFYD